MKQLTLTSQILGSIERMGAHVGKVGVARTPINFLKFDKPSGQSWKLLQKGLYSVTRCLYFFPYFVSRKMRGYFFRKTKTKYSRGDIFLDVETCRR